MKSIKAEEYDNVVSEWREWQSYPWSDLLYRIIRFNIQRHTGTTPLRILDVGGGNGLNTIYYAKQGHAVTLLDYSPVMIQEAKRFAKQENVYNQIDFIQAGVENIEDVLSEQEFDLILCHLVISFLAEPLAVVQEISQLMASGGLISILAANRYSEVYRAAFQVNDLDAAMKKIGAKEYFHPWFEQMTPLFSSREVIEALAECGCELVGDYGVRCLCDYLPNEPKYETEYFEKLEQIECKLTDTYPYNLLARFYQVVMRKQYLEYRKKAT